MRLTIRCFGKSDERRDLTSIKAFEHLFLIFAFIVSPVILLLWKIELQKK